MPKMFCKIDEGSVYLEEVYNSYRMIYECDVRESEFKEDAIKRAKRLAAFRRLYCVDYDFWL